MTAGEGVTDEHRAAHQPPGPSAATVAERIARWEARDAIVGLDAEHHELRRRIDESEAEVAALRARLEQLAQRHAQAQVELDTLRAQLAVAARPPAWRRILGPVVRPVVRIVRAVARRVRPGGSPT